MDIASMSCIATGVKNENLLTNAQKDIRNVQLNVPFT